jgi:hypothetical protein
MLVKRRALQRTRYSHVAESPMISTDDCSFSSCRTRDSLQGGLSLKLCEFLKLLAASIADSDIVDIEDATILIRTRICHVF